MMDKAAQHLEDESRTRIHRAAVMIVPVVIIIMGIIVGIMIARFYLGFYMGMMD
jgi:type II secretory pathway component PulF